MTQFMIYGATGYTGELTTRFAVQQDLRPVIAGRDPVKVNALSQQYGLEGRAFSLDDPAEVDRNLAGMAAVLHCAGPYRYTWQQMVQACLRTGTHYLDITGEFEVFEGIHALHEQAKDAGIVLLPGVGFDVAPTDCLAVHLKQRLPAATHLSLAFYSYGPAYTSRGTAKTFIENLNLPGSIRRDGKLIDVPHLSKARAIDFGRGEKVVQRMPWGDLVTAYISTGIPNIETYFRVAPILVTLLRLARFLQPLSGLLPVKAFLYTLINTRPAGSSDEARERSGVAVWGEVQDAEGNTAVSRLHTMEAYTLTALTALKAVERVITGEISSGSHTPGTAFGPDFILELAEITREDIQ